MFRRAYAVPSENASTKPKTTTELPMTLTVEQLQTELNISRKTAYELVKKDGFPAFCIGNRILIDRESLRTWIAQQIQKTN